MTSQSVPAEEETPRPPKTGGLKISVIVPCFNGEGHLRECLASLSGQSRKAHEIILVDDASTDGSAALAEAMGATVVRRGERGGAAAARAEGAARASGDVLAFLDADCAAPSGWLKEMALAFEQDEGLGGVGGGYSHRSGGGLLARLSAWEEEYVHHVFARHPDEAVPPGGNSAYRKDVWKAARSGRELVHFGGMGSGEDTVVGQEIRRHARVRFFENLRVGHASRGGTGYFRRHYNRGLSRSTIFLHRLSDRPESSLALDAYGGFRLFLAGFFLPLAAASVLAGFWIGRRPALALALGFLAAHVLLSAPFFHFLRDRDRETGPSGSLGFWGRQLLRPILFARSLCWIAGALAGLWRALAARAALYWNVSLSVLHFWRPGRISKLFYFVNSQCNARCEFCFNLDNVVGWQARKPTELTLAEVEKIAKNFGRLPFLTLSGGEPFMRQDLPGVVRAFHRLAKTQWVTIPTNASLTDRTLAAVREILVTCPALFLTIQISIDSMYEDHDKSRKIAGGFEKMTRTVKGLSRLRREHKNLRIQLATCFGEFNRKRMDEIVDYCRTNFEFDQQMFYLIRDTRTPVTGGNAPLLDEYLGHIQRNETREWGLHRHGLWHRAVRALQGMVYNDMKTIITDTPYLRPCHATEKFATLYDNGEITPCEILEKSVLGNVRDHGYDFYRLKKERDVARFHRKEILEKKCSCDWMCAIPINSLYDVKSVPRALAAVLRPDRVVKT